MARPIRVRDVRGILPQIDPRTPGLIVGAKPQWSPPQGVDYLNRKNRISDQHMSDALNMYLDRGVTQSRHGTTQIGTVASAAGMGVVNFVTGSGIGFLLRFTITKLQRYDGTDWVDVGTTTFTGGTSNYFVYTAFNDTLIFSNGVDGLFEYAPLTGGVTLIADGPNAKHLTTFGGRVIASAADGLEYRTRWSVKNNSHDWTGIGSGFEDLLSTPGGQVDGVLGTWPISDTTALMVRTNSIYQVTQSGDPDAPYRFDILHANLGSRSRYSIDVIPGGIIMLGTDDVYIITQSGFQDLGKLSKDRIFAETTDLTKVRGIYRPKLKEYWLSLGSNRLYRYAFQDKGWTPHEYPFAVRWFDDSIFHYSGITWDEATGTWDSQTTTWDSMVGISRPDSFYFVTTEANANVLEEDITSSVDGYTQTGFAASGMLVQTSELLASTPLEKVEIIEVQLEYESAQTQTLVFEYSSDGGVTWIAYSTKTIGVTTRKQILRCMKTLSRESLIFRMRSTVIGKLIVTSLSPFVVLEAKVAP